jgi:His/Glu/Gln/Arg/opine family amino acid ABC transporter permease subunit
VYQFRFEVVFNNMPFLLNGLYFTFLITVFSIIGALVCGLIAALLRLSRLPVISQLVRLYIDFFRGTPVLVQLIWIYYALPIVTGISFSALVSAIVTLSLNMGAFLGEIFRAGIQSIDRGQREAAFVLGLDYGQTMREIVLPQALARMLPPIGSSLIIILKDSSLASFIAVSELTYQGTVLQASTFRPIEILTVVALIYFFLNLPLTWLVEYLERRTGVRERH